MANQKGSMKKGNSNGLTWFKNVGKSLGLSTMDVISEMMPATLETITNNKDTVTSLYDSIKTFRSRNTTKLDDMLTGKAKENYNTLKNAIKNAREDLASGNFYNSGRIESSFDDGFDIDMDFSDSLGDDSFSDDSSSSTESNVVVPDININSNITKNNPMVKAVQSQSALLAETADAQAKRDTAIARSQITVNKQIGDALYGGMHTINENLSLLVNFHSNNMTKYISASLKYYEDQLQITKEAFEAYKLNNPPKEEKQTNVKTNPMDDIISASGGFNLGAYANLVKKQVNDAIDSNLITSSIKMMFEDTDTLASMAQSPLKFVTEAIVKKFIPTYTAKAMKKFDETLNGFFPAMLMKITNLQDSDNPLLQLVGNIFGVKSRNKTTIDTDKYERGQVPFDGITRKSIIEVIPGYLSKIHSALTGKTDLAYNYETGKFESVREIQDANKAKDRSTILGQYEYFNDIKDRIDALDLKDEDEKKDFATKIEDMFINMTNNGKLIDPRNLDDLREVFTGTSDELKVVRKLITSLDYGQQIKTFGGRDIYNARKARTERYDKMEEEPGSIGAVLFNGLYDSKNDITSDNPLLKTYGSGKNKRASIFNPSDQYGYSMLDYLRDIKRALYEGVKVFMGSSSEELDNRLSNMNEFERKTNVVNPDSVRTYSRRLNSTGRYNSIYDLPDEDVLEGMIGEWIENKEKEAEPEKKKKKWFNVDKFLKGDAKEKYESIRAGIDKIFSFPANAISKFFNKVDKSMYEIVFGKSEEGGKSDAKNESFFGTLITKITGKFSSFFGYVKDKMIAPIHDALLGDEGLITKFKESDYWKNVREKATQFGNYLFGEKDGDGVRQGGLFSDTANEVGDMFKGFKYYFTGKAYTDSKGQKFEDNEDSVFGNVKSMFGSFKNTLKEYFFGKDGEKKGQLKGVFTDSISMIKSGFQNFADAIFGPKKFGDKDNENYVNMEEVFGKMKDHAPKALAHGMIGAGAGIVASLGGMGALGSIFLGPFSGAAIGIASSFLFKSDKFKNWLFGEKDDNGERIGGFITKSTQEFFKKHKTAIAGGAAIGAVKGMLGGGFLSSFVLGGPITGALMGVASSLLFKSEKFKTFLFGEEQQDGKRMGGFLNKLMGKKNDAEKQ